MPLSVPLLFHFNQHFTEYARVASRVCYCGLLKVLRSHPALKFNIHISGTLVHALQWVDPEPLELIRDGLNDGQFELLGSTYAQNVLYASDDWDNARQIDLHKKVLHDTFGVAPVTFWNVERCWRQSLAPLIAGAGYHFTLVEDHILRRAGAVSPFTYTTRADDHTLTVITDDETLKHKLNLAAWFGREMQALNYLRAAAAQLGADNMCIAYAEDAEAMGLWGWEDAGAIPNQTWAHLDHLLTAFEAESDLQLIKLSDAPSPSVELTPIPDGSGAWMDASLRTVGAPYHEDGYADWFDFNRRAPKLGQFRHTYTIIRNKLQALAPNSAGAEKLRQAALHVYCAHQYEFGCIGVGGLNQRGWENARTATAVARAAKAAESPAEFVVIDDCNGDGMDEVLICDGVHLLITSAYGGRLLYWFDLLTGQQFVGNQLPVIPADYAGDGHFPIIKSRPVCVLPESDSPQYVDHCVEEMPPTRMGRYLPDWVWQGEPTPLKLAASDKRSVGHEMPLMAQTRVFADHVRLDHRVVEEPPEEWLDSRLEKSGVTFVRYLSDELTLEKTLRLILGKPAAMYAIRNHDTRERWLRLRVTNELCPDYAEVISGGSETLRFLEARNGGSPGVMNTLTRTAILIGSTRAWEHVEERVDFCALTIGLVYDITLAPRSEQRFEIRLKKTVRG